MDSKNPDRYVVNRSLELGVQLKVRRRGGVEPFHVDMLRAENPLELMKLVLSLKQTRGERISRESLSASAFEFCIRSGLLVREQDQPKQVTFQCGLTEDVLPLIPNDRLNEFVPARTDLVVNPSLLLRLDRREVVRSQWGRFPPDRDVPIGPPMAWITDPATRISWAYSLDETTAAVLSNLKNEDAPPAETSPEMTKILLLAQILVDRAFWRRRCALWERLRLEARKFLQENKYVLLSDLVPPWHLACLRKYLRELEAEGYLYLASDQAAGMRFVMNNDPVVSYLHRQTGKLLCEVTGESVFPSYSLVSAYLPAAVLKRHKDRPQCRWNGSLLVDMNPEVRPDDSWPLYLDVAGQVTKVSMGMGDCLIYRGTEIPHWRDELPSSRRQTLVLLHYVPIDFPGRID